MTDRMTNIEIEDVLSSIRRLVSEELRPAAEPAAPAPAAKQPPARLVLTPAFRVPAPESDAPQGPPAAVAQHEPVVQQDAPLEARIAELEALLAADPQAFEPDEGEAFPLMSSLHRGNRPDAEPAQDVRSAFVGDPPRAPATQPLADMADEAEPEAADAEAPFVFDTTPDDGDEPDPGAGPSSLAWTLRAPLMPEDPDSAGVGADDDALTEAAALRELVRDVLREELQGQIGERVTRNLRKLVRAEIARALAARGLV